MQLFENLEAVLAMLVIICTCSKQFPMHVMRLRCINICRWRCEENEDSKVFELLKPRARSSAPEQLVKQVELLTRLIPNWINCQGSWRVTTECCQSLPMIARRCGKFSQMGGFPATTLTCCCQEIPPCALGRKINGLGTLVQTFCL